MTLDSKTSPTPPYQLLAGRYRIGERIAGDAIGSIYAGHDEHFDRPVTIKLVDDVDVEAAPRRERLMREARVLGATAHPGLVRVYDLELAHSPPFMVTARGWAPPMPPRPAVTRTCPAMSAPPRWRAASAKVSKVPCPMPWVPM